MSTESAVLALRLKGPMQAWGFNSQFNRRDTALFPTKSALCGLCCAAMGKNRGSEEEKNILQKFTSTKLTCIAVPLKTRWKELTVKRMQDYHTVQNTRDAKGKMKGDAVLTYRQYLNDALFIALFEGKRSFLQEVAEGLQNPTWGVWLGRKSCVPSAPVFAGVYSSKEEALGRIPELDGNCIEHFSRMTECASFGEGIDSYMDQPVSFDIHGREFVPRRVLLQEATA